MAHEERPAKRVAFSLPTAERPMYRTTRGVRSDLAKLRDPDDIDFVEVDNEYFVAYPRGRTDPSSSAGLSVFYILPDGVVAVDDETAAVRWCKKKERDPSGRRFNKFCLYAADESAWVDTPWKCLQDKENHGSIIPNEVHAAATSQTAPLYRLLPDVRSDGGRTIGHSVYLDSRNGEWTLVGTLSHVDSAQVLFEDLQRRAPPASSSSDHGQFLAAARALAGATTGDDWMRVKAADDLAMELHSYFTSGASVRFKFFCQGLGTTAQVQCMREALNSYVVESDDYNLTVAASKALSAMQTIAQGLDSASEAEADPPFTPDNANSYTEHEHTFRTAYLGGDKSAGLLSQVAMAYLMKLARRFRIVQPRLGIILQKLLFFADSASVASCGERLLFECSEAWDLGPVYPHARSYFNDYYAHSSLSVPPIEPEHRAFLDAAFAQYSSLSPQEASQLIHETSLWRKVQRNDPLHTLLLSETVAKRDHPDYSIVKPLLSDP